MNVTANSIAALLGPGAPASVQAGQVQVGKYPSIRSRRPRETIDLDLSEEEQRTLSPDEIKKLKNRVAAKRARIRAGQRLADLESTVRELWKRVQYLERVIQLLHPNEPMDYLYSKYIMYADSPNLEPLGPSSDKSALVPLDMRELEWLLHTSPRGCNDVEMEG